MRPNFYQLLDLDPDVDDWPTIEARLQAKQREWSAHRSGGNPKQRREAARAFELLAEMEETLRDDQARRAEARAERLRRRQESEERSRELDETIEILRAAGVCREPEIEKLVRRFDGVFAEREIRARLRAAGIRTDDGAAEGRRFTAERIDESVARRLRRNLEVTGHATLYELLDLRPQSSPEALVARASEIQGEIQRLGKIDAVTSATNALAGEAKVLFADDPAKAKYDAHLAVEAMESLKTNVDLAAQDGYVSKNELDALVRQARARGVSAEDARAWIEEYAERKGVGVEREAELPVESLRQCGFCGQLVASETAEACPRCGEALELRCPRCDSPNPSDHAACETCGARVGDAPMVFGLLREAQSLATAGDLAQAEIRLRKALDHWGNWKPAAELLAGIEQRRKAREGRIDAVESELRACRLLAAREALERLERELGGGGLERLRERIESGIAEAEALFRQGEAHRRAGRTDPALDLFEQTLAVVADHRGARRAMAASPPTPPVGLVAQPLAQGFRLTWKPGSTRSAARYRVVRKAGAAPRDEGDGETMAEVREARLDDSPVPVGTAWHYAVFAVRGGVASRSAARSGPHLRTAEAQGVVATARQGEVVIAFEPPAGCLRVEVWGGAGVPPRRPGEGRRLSVSGTTARDRGLTDGRRYGYRITAVFADPATSGGEIVTPGVTVEAVPSAPPAPVRDLTAERRGRSVFLSWTPVPEAAVEIRWSHEAPPYRPGEILNADRADRFGRPILATGHGSARFELDSQGRLVFVPLTLRDDLLVPGEAFELLTLDPVENLAARKSGRTVLLTWTWPEGVDEVLVRHGTHDTPSDPRSGPAARLNVGRSAYERDGGVLLEALEERTHHVAVFARAPGGDLYSAPATVTVELGRSASVAYAVRVRRQLFGRRISEAWVELESEGGARPEIPPLRLVGKSHGVPVHPEDGKLLERIESVDFHDGRGRIPIPERHWSSKLYCKLFFDDPSRGTGIRLLPAARERLRID